jgi:hypothetical protein
MVRCYSHVFTVQGDSEQEAMDKLEETIKPRDYGSININHLPWVLVDQQVTPETSGELDDR